jgi:cytidyltransferase-like protein
LLRAIRFVQRVVTVGKSNVQSLKPKVHVGVLVAAAGEAGVQPDLLAVNDVQDSAANRAYCETRGIDYWVVREEDLRGFPESALDPRASSANRKRVVATGCYDWVHSGHVRFFEEVSAYGDLYVIVGHDANIRLLKGPGHPLFPQEERRYVVGSIRYVTQALITSGEGWLDADPEIRRLQPDIYAVNEDGDKGGKREYCAKLGIEYLVLKRAPAPGLPQRTSTDLRGF